jgi:UDP-N-acetylmuramate--alanine ligase
MPLSEKSRNIHFVGIGGIGMSGLAELLMAQGHRVTGSDLSDSEAVKRLKGLGAEIQLEHGKAILEKYPPHVLVYSTAVSRSNPELLYAREHKIPIVRRAEMLAEIMRLKRGIAVAGSHGKTTTTGMLSMILKEAGKEPTVIIGGRFDAIGSNAAWGGGEWLVAEADESDGSFLKLSPEYAIVTNIDHEHMDHYGSMKGALGAFSEFLDRLPFYGKAFLCSDSPLLRELAPTINKAVSWYGFEKEHQPDFLLKILEEGASPRFEIYSRSDDYASVQMTITTSVPGRHNMLNAAAAALLARELDVSVASIAQGLRSFRGVRRRFELKGAIKGISIYEDYAHHPTEVEATLRAARSVFPANKVVAIFQPHRYSRTKLCWDDFAKCFAEASEVLTLPIYAASEKREAWAVELDDANFAQHIAKPQALFMPDFDAVAKRIAAWMEEGKLKEGDAIFVLGAGDVYKVIPKILPD